MIPLPPTITLTILASHKQGHVMQCEGVARALGAIAQTRPVAPRGLFRLIAPWGPPDPRDLGDGAQAALRQPFPDIALASGRETVPYLRAMKKKSAGKTFCVYLGDPRFSRATFDLIALPEHDAYRGDNVITYLTTPHPRDEAARAIARADPDPRVGALVAPRIAILLGGPSDRYRFTDADIDAIADIARLALNKGAGMMVSPSRRTPPALLARLRETAIAFDPTGARTFIWDGSGANPYMSMLALADSFVVTADSVNMISEAVATGRPVHLYEPTGKAGKFANLLDQLIARQALRRWRGSFEEWTYAPIDSTGEVAEEIARRYCDFLARRARSRQR